MFHLLGLSLILSGIFCRFQITSLKLLLLNVLLSILLFFDAIVNRTVFLIFFFLVVVAGVTEFLLILMYNAEQNFQMELFVPLFEERSQRLRMILYGKPPSLLK